MTAVQRTPRRTGSSRWRETRRLAFQLKPSTDTSEKQRQDSGKVAHSEKLDPDLHKAEEN